jgi:hypothetical protein
MLDFYAADTRRAGNRLRAGRREIQLAHVIAGI